MGIAGCLHDVNASVRCLVALGLGHWGGEEVVESLNVALTKDMDETVRLHCVRA
jgi:hypothetical protein